VISRTALLIATVMVAAIGFVGCGGEPRQGLARGAELYDTCQPCHGVRGDGNATVGAPAIAGLPRWYVEAQLEKFKQGIRGAHPDDVHGALMRPMARTLNHDGDVGSVAQYVATLPGTHAPATLQGGDATAGSARYNGVCVACHGPDGKGNEALSSPALVGQADWYMLHQLQKFKSGMRGAHPDDVTGSQMRAMSMTLENDQAMLDVIAFIRTLK
jgi:cytochrome c oxidase subunit 2